MRDLRNGEECKGNLTIAEDKTIRKVGESQYVMRASTLAYSSWELWYLSELGLPYPTKKHKLEAYATNLQAGLNPYTIQLSSSSQRLYGIEKMVLNCFCNSAEGESIVNDELGSNRMKVNNREFIAWMDFLILNSFLLPF